MIQICSKNWTAVVAPECGSNVISLRHGSFELLRTPQSLEQLKGRPCLYGMPLLLPANRLADARFAFEGKTYTLPMNEPAFCNHIHGLMKDAPFCVINQTENSVTTAIENDGSYYPFPFWIEITDTVTDDGLVRTLRLRNTGNMTMPYTIAFHNTFAEPECFCVPIKARCEMDERYIPTGVLLPLTAQQEAYRDGMSPDGSKVSGVYTTSGHVVQIGNYVMSVSEQFDHWVLFNGSGTDGYLCIEPQCGAVNGLNNHQHKILHPGEEELFIIKISLK